MCSNALAGNLRLPHEFWVSSIRNLHRKTVDLGIGRPSENRLAPEGTAP